jgi:hypothetical protein
MNRRVSYSFDLDPFQDHLKIQSKPTQTRSKSNLRPSHHPKFPNPIKLPFLIKDPKPLKQVNLNISPRFTSVKPQNKSSQRLSLPKSLNFSCRQQEAKKIFHENSRIFKRLSKISPIINVKRQKEDYQKSLAYKRTISRATFSKNLKKLSFFCINSRFSIQAKRENFTSIDYQSLKFPVPNEKKLMKKKSETSLLQSLKNDSICQSSLNLSNFLLSLE